MPVSTPSYFPNQRGNRSIIGITAGNLATAARVFLAGQNAGRELITTSGDDIIALGDDALSDGDITDANAAGSIVIGSQAAENLANFTDSHAGPCVIVGVNAAQLLPDGGANVIVGANALANHAAAGGSSCSGNVILGSKAARTPTGGFIQGSVIIGSQAAEGSATASYSDCVVIGRAACSNRATQLVSSIAIGTGALGSSTHNGTIAGVYIGTGSGSSCTTATLNTFVGNGTNCTSGSANTLIGDNSQVAAGSRNTKVGRGTLGILTGDENIIIGHQADAGETTTNSQRLIVATYDDVTIRTLLYGSLANGCLIVGNSQPGTSREFAGAGATNFLKILAGTPGSTNPVGGGYFYFNAVTGLHFVGSAGTDTILAPP